MNLLQQVHETLKRKRAGDVTLSWPGTTMTQGDIWITSIHFLHVMEVTQIVPEIASFGINDIPFNYTTFYADYEILRVW